MSEAAPLAAWSFEETEPKEKVQWKKSEAPPEEDDRLLEQALHAARGIVSERFDEEAPTILAAAFDRAETFLRTQSREMKKRLGCFPPTPNISPGPNGSADLHWEQTNWGLLVNVPSTTDDQATFYGDCKEGAARIKDSFDPANWNLGIMSWLSKM